MKNSITGDLTTFEFDKNNTVQDLKKLRDALVKKKERLEESYSRGKIAKSKENDSIRTIWRIASLILDCDRFIDDRQREERRQANPHPNRIVLTAELRRRTEDSLNETKKGLAAEMKYSPHLRNSETIRGYEKHINRLETALKNGFLDPS